MDRHSKYNELLQRHLPMVWRLCWLRARGDYERCRDLVQEVSFALWLHIDGLRQGVSAKEEKAWVRWLTRTTLDHLHRSQRPPMLALTDAMAETLSDADNAAVAEDIEELMAALSPEEQQLMRLHIEGYRADEIAEAMGLRREAVYQRMHRAVAKARRVLLALFLLLVVSTVAVAVVPSWRRWVFGGGEPAAADTLPVGVPASASTAPPAVADTATRDTVVQRHAWNPPAPIPHLVAFADTTLPHPLPGFAEPCGCPEGYRRKPQSDSLDLFSDACEPWPEEEADVTIRVVGNTIVVEGVRDERVDVFDAQGRLVATARCNDHCVLTIGMQDHSYTRASTGTNAYWVQVGGRPRQQVFIDQHPRGKPTHPIPASTQRILMF